MITPLQKIIEVHAPRVERIIPWVNGEALLTAIAIIESNYGNNVGPRHENAYDYGGVYQNKELLDKYGRTAACSYGAWQIMFLSAYELNFRGHPTLLAYDEIGIYSVVAYLDKRIARKSPETLQDIFDAWNSGSFRDAIVPQVYIDKGMIEYMKYMNQGEL